MSVNGHNVQNRNSVAVVDIIERDSGVLLSLEDAESHEFLRSRSRTLVISNGKPPTDACLSLLKWLALGTMVIDHINTYLLSGLHEWMSVIGRVSMPLFVYVLGCNLARHKMREQRRSVYARTAKRLLICASIATVPYVALNDLAAGWWPLNFVFSLLAGTLTIAAFDSTSKWRLVIVLIVVAWFGAVTDYWWPPIIACLAVWSYYRDGKGFKLLIFAACLMMIYATNRNWWALCAIPMIILAQKWRYTLPRAQLFFYLFYPLHFYVFWGLKLLR